VRGGHWHALQSKCIEELNVGALDEPSKVCNKDPPLLGRQSAILALLLDMMIFVLPHRSLRRFRTCSKSKKGDSSAFLGSPEEKSRHCDLSEDSELAFSGA
jgi:hypothetical protein